jgi:septal ring factor EnvC (AmiA/AmiB activator)
VVKKRKCNPGNNLKSAPSWVIAWFNKLNDNRTRIIQNERTIEEIRKETAQLRESTNRQIAELRETTAEQKKTTAEIRETNCELKKSNAELKKIVNIHSKAILHLLNKSKRT